VRKKIGLGGKKDLNADLNLTPFIDLLSTCVCFLLITAVWIEVGTVDIKQSHGTEAAESKKETYDLDVVFKGASQARLNLKRNGKAIKRIDIKGEEFAGFLTKLETAVTTEILSVKNKAITIASATITPRSTVNYGGLISTLDVLRRNKIVNIGVLTAKGQ
jgi:biopolymer transport protein TolR